jgi:hypothetical protein
MVAKKRRWKSIKSTPRTGRKDVAGRDDAGNAERKSAKSKARIYMSFLRRSFKSRAFQLAAVSGLVAILIVVLRDTGRTPFKVTISDFEGIRYDEAIRNDDPTSPLCGCLNDSVPHDGIMIPAKSCVFRNNNKSDAATNFLITCPSESSIGPWEAFGFACTVYRFTDPQFRDIPLRSLSRLISDSIGRLPAQRSELNFGKEDYFSIITHGEVEVYGESENTILSFITPVRSLTDANKVKSRFDGNVSGININSRTTLDSIGQVLKVPALDIFSGRVFIRWTDSVKILSPRGIYTESYFANGEKKGASGIEIAAGRSSVRTNVAILLPKHNLRVSLLPWDKTYEQDWKADFLAQFNLESGEPYFFYHGMPILNIKTGEPIILKDSIRPYKTPTYLTPLSNVSVEFSELTPEAVYNELYEKFRVNGGYWYQYQPDDFEYVRFREVTDAVTDSVLFKQLLQRKYHYENASDLLSKQKHLLSLIDWNKAKDGGRSKLPLQDRQEYFRYPPLHKSPGVSFYTQVSNVEFFKCDGTVIVGDKSFPIKGQTLQLQNLDSVKYAYPSFFSKLGSSEGSFFIEGMGTVTIDGTIIQEKIWEGGIFLWISTIGCLFGLLYGIAEFIRSIHKKES